MVGWREEGAEYSFFDCERTLWVGEDAGERRRFFVRADYYTNNGSSFSDTKRETHPLLPLVPLYVSTSGPAFRCFLAKRMRFRCAERYISLYYIESIINRSPLEVAGKSQILPDNGVSGAGDPRNKLKAKSSNTIVSIIVIVRRSLVCCWPLLLSFSVHCIAVAHSRR